MNKKGFTLIEVLAAISVVSLLFTIGIPTVLKLIKSGTNSYYTSLEKEIKVAGVDYLETYRSLLPQHIGHVAVVTIDELVENKYIDEVKDEKGNACTGKVSVEKIKTDSYAYHTCLICGDYYSSEQKECEYDANNNVYVDSGDYRIVVPTKSIEIEQSKEFKLPLAEVYYKEDPVPIKTDLEGDPSKLNTNKIGTYDVVYYYHGAKETIQVKILDTTKPSKVQVVMRYTNSKGISYKDDWFSGDIYVAYKATDYTKSGVKGSGIDHYEVSTDGINFVTLDKENQSNYKRLSATEQLMLKEGNYVRYVRAVDKAGNIGPISYYRTRIDKTKPTCSWAGESTDWQPNLNQPANQRVTARTITATCSDSVSECTTATKSKTWIEENSVKTKKLSYTMEDLAGNTQICEKTVNVYIDKTTPTISSVDLALDATPYHFADNTKGNITTTCNYSSCTLTCDPADSKGTSVYDVTCTLTSAVGLSATTTFKAKHQYEAEPTNIQDKTWCGTEKCNPRQSCTSGQDCWCTKVWCNEGLPDAYLCCGEPRGCTPWQHCTTKYDTCISKCDVYDCVDGAVHADGSTRSKTDKTCYYK